MNEEKIRKPVEDLGVAAYLKIHGFKLAGRKGNVFFFDIRKKDEEEFNKTSIDYINSAFHDYDAQIMALKKVPRNYLPEVIS